MSSRSYRLPLFAAFSQRAGASLALALCLLWTCAAFGGPALAAAPAVPLRPVSVQSFSSPQEAWKNTVTPAFKEERFALSKAANLEAVAARVGGLSEAEKNYLEKHRFVLLPRAAHILQSPPSAAYSPGYDEMLGLFDEIGGGSNIMNRQPAAGVFVGPDPFLHALHAFFVERLKNMEQTELSRSLYRMLGGLYANAVALRASAGKAAEADWERLQAQLVVPLILMRNTSLPGGILMYHENDTKNLEEYLYDADTLAKARGEEEPKAGDRADSLERALALFNKEYKHSFSPKTADAIVEELKRIYGAKDRAPSLLGLVPAYGGDKIDYTQFQPRGHYEGSPISRAYFRAMIQLGQAGWNLKTEPGVKDALNFALVMSYKGAGKEKLDHDPLDSWRTIMEISGFFVGSPDAASYPEWQAFVRQHAGAEALAPGVASDTAVLAKLRDNIGSLKASTPYFADLQTMGATSVLCVLPQRFTIPWLISDELSWKNTPEQKKLPVVTSGLWVPAVLGSEYARGLLDKQGLLSWQGLPNATLEGDPAPDGGKVVSPENIPPEAVEAVAVLKARLDNLALALQKESEASWHSSIGALWLRLLGNLTAAYGEGYPLYMRDAAFGAKQLESFMGSYTELKHDTLLYEKPNYAEAGEGGDDETSPPVPKGLVEPNPVFWHSLLGTVDYVIAGFTRYGLYPEDLEEYGSLRLFRDAVALCAALAEKELRGEVLSDDDYEAMRAITLQHMAAPKGSSVRTEQDVQSGLIVDVQTANLNDPNKPPVIVYEATAAPRLMLVLAGNQDAPRVTIGVAYTHREFITPYGPRLTDSAWKQRAYAGSPYPTVYEEAWTRNEMRELPPRNFWYDVLEP